MCLGQQILMSELWHEVNRLFLRLPRQLANNLRQKSFDLVSKQGFIKNEEKFTIIPFTVTEPIYFGLTGSGHIEGLQLSKEQPLNVTVPRYRG